MKIFCIGLPRTGTTTLSIELTKMGYKTCHCVFDPKQYRIADAFADTPIFADYKKLDQEFPNSKFIYLERDIDSWLESFTRIYSKFINNLRQPTTKEQKSTRISYRKIFGGIHMEPTKLREAFIRHYIEVNGYFDGRDDFLSINIANPYGRRKLAAFLNQDETIASFPYINQGNQGDAWNLYGHPNKISSE